MRGAKVSRIFSFERPGQAWKPLEIFKFFGDPAARADDAANTLPPMRATRVLIGPDTF